MALIVLIAAITINLILWKLYRRDLLRDNRKLRKDNETLIDWLDEVESENRALVQYNVELHQRCERYREAMVTEALAAKMRIGPAARLHPIQRKNAIFVIENNLN